MTTKNTSPPGGATTALDIAMNARDLQPRVFITQVPNSRDPVTKEFMPTYNVAPAEVHGRITIMQPARAEYVVTSGALAEQLREHLSEYDFMRGDAVLPLGDPVISATTFGVLAQDHDSYRVLKWDRHQKRYLVCEVHL